MKNILLFVAISFTLLACKKEKQIERNLWKNGGEWNIDTYYLENLSPDPNENTIISLTNAGTLTFNEDRTGKMVLVNGSEEDVQDFSYTNTKDNLTIILADGSIPLNYEIEWKKNKMSLNFKFSITTDGETYGIINKMDLTKK